MKKHAKALMKLTAGRLNLTQNTKHERKTVQLDVTLKTRSHGRMSGGFHQIFDTRHFFASFINTKS